MRVFNTSFFVFLSIFGLASAQVQIEQRQNQDENQDRTQSQPNEDENVPFPDDNSSEIVNQLRLPSTVTVNDSRVIPEPHAGTFWQTYVNSFSHFLQSHRHPSAGRPHAPSTTTTTASPVPGAPYPSSSSSCVCGVRNENPRIVGGTESGVNEFPWRCFLYSRRNGAFCAATIISAEWIMTAAHCTDVIKSGESLNVICGDHDLTKTTETRQVVRTVDRVAQNPNYNKKTMDSDMSLLHLSEKLVWSKTISPACLPWKGQGQDCEGQPTVIASGWGVTSYKGSASTVLRKTELPCLSTTGCQKYYKNAVTNNMICTYSPQKKDACQGDSGGSIDYKNSDGRYYALGVVSWGEGCATLNSPGVYTKVTKYLSWIRATTGDNTFCNS